LKENAKTRTNAERQKENNTAANNDNRWRNASRRQRKPPMMDSASIKNRRQSSVYVISQESHAKGHGCKHKFRAFSAIKFPEI